MGIVEWNADRILRDVESGTRTAMDQAGKKLAGQAKADLSKPYPPASRRGEPPHTRTGALAGAQEHRVTTEGGDVVLVVGTGPGLRYAGVMASTRPWLAVSPTAEMVTGIVADNVKRSLG